MSINDLSGNDPRSAVPVELRAPLADWLRHYVRNEGREASVLCETPPQELRAMLKWGAVVEDDHGNARLHPAFYVGLLHAADCIEMTGRAMQIMADADPPESGVLYGSGHPVSEIPLP